jgi:hypothetical protein
MAPEVSVARHFLILLLVCVAHNKKDERRGPALALWTRREGSILTPISD